MKIEHKLQTIYTLTQNAMLKTMSNDFRHAIAATV